MEIAPDDQMTVDFDWFCVDGAGEIGHFTTAGFKQLPATVRSSAEDLARVTKYFEEELSPRRGYVVDADLALEIPEASDRGERYLRSFVAMADRGLFSYDIESHLKPGICYFRVASPLSPLRLEELPETICEIVGRTTLKGRFLRTNSRIPYEDTLGI